MFIINGITEGEIPETITVKIKVEQVTGFRKLLDSINRHLKQKFPPFTNKDEIILVLKKSSTLTLRQSESLIKSLVLQENKNNQLLSVSSPVSAKASTNASSPVPVKPIQKVKDCADEAYKFLKEFFYKDKSQVYGYAWDEVLAQTLSWRMNANKPRTKEPIAVSLPDKIGENWMVCLECPQSFYLMNFFQEVREALKSAGGIMDIEYGRNKFYVSVCFKELDKDEKDNNDYWMVVKKNQVEQLKAAISSTAEKYAKMRGVLAAPSSSSEIQETERIKQAVLSVVPVSPLCQIIMEYWLTESVITFQMKGFAELPYLMPLTLKLDCPLIQQLIENINNNGKHVMNPMDSQQRKGPRYGIFPLRNGVINTVLNNESKEDIFKNKEGFVVCFEGMEQGLETSASCWEEPKTAENKLVLRP